MFRGVKISVDNTIKKLYSSRNFYGKLEIVSTASYKVHTLMLDLPSRYRCFCIHRLLTLLNFYFRLLCVFFRVGYSRSIFTFSEIILRGPRSVRVTVKGATTRKRWRTTGLFHGTENSNVIFQPES